MTYYIVRLTRGGCYRIQAENAEDARQRVTYDYHETVASVARDDNWIKDQGIDPVDFVGP